MDNTTRALFLNRKTQYVTSTAKFITFNLAGWMEKKYL